MTTLSTSDAVELVRKNLDELDPVDGNASVMYTDEASDNESLTNTILRFLPEAINAVQKAAPVSLLEGKVAVVGDIGSASIESGVLSFTLASNSDFLRLVAFRMKDSAIVVTDAIEEASAEGRKQLNPYICGRPDRPRLVHLQGKHTEPSFKYYKTTNSDDNNTATVFAKIDLLEFVQEQFYDEDAENYNISRRLRQNIIDCCTAMVMETYGDQRAQSYYQKATIYK